MESILNFRMKGLVIFWSLFFISVQGQEATNNQRYDRQVQPPPGMGYPSGNYNGGYNSNYQQQQSPRQPPPVSQRSQYVFPPPPPPQAQYMQPPTQQPQLYRPQPQPVYVPQQPTPVPYQQTLQQPMYVQPQQQVPIYNQQPYYNQPQLQQQQQPLYNQQPQQQPLYNQQPQQQPLYNQQQQPLYNQQQQQPLYNQQQPMYNQQQAPVYNQQQQQQQPNSYQPPSAPYTEYQTTTPPPETTTTPSTTTTTTTPPPISIIKQKEAEINGSINFDKSADGLNIDSGLNAGIDAGINANVDGTNTEGQQTNTNQQESGETSPSSTTETGNVLAFPEPANDTLQARSLSDSPTTTTPDAATTVPAKTPTNNETLGIPKSQLIKSVSNLNLSDPASLVSLTGLPFTRHQIWYLTGKILERLDERLRPDYVTMLPPPLQKGIPTKNITQVLLPTVGPEVFRALVEESSGMLPSQLSTISQAIRLSEPFKVKTLLSSADPNTLLSLYNPRQLQINIQTIIRTLLSMPEMGRFGAKSVRAKLLPKTLMNIWLSSVNQSRWTAADLLGQSPVGDRNELQYTILGLSCQDIFTLPPTDILPVVEAMRLQIFNIRSSQRIEFPMELRRCILEKVIEYLQTKATNNATHILNILSPADIKAIGGEILSAIPTAAIQKINPEIRKVIIEAIGRLDAVSLITFASPKKLNFLADEVFTGLQTLKLDGRSAGDDESDLDTTVTTDSASPTTTDMKSNSTVNSTPDNTSTDNKETNTTITSDTGNKYNSTTTNSTSPMDNKENSTKTDDPLITVPRTIDALLDKNVDLNAEVHLNKGDSPEVIAFPLPENTTTVKPLNMNPGGMNDQYRRRRRQAPSQGDMDNLSIIGSLYCYSINMMELNWDKEKIKNFLELKENQGETTCCMDKISRNQWNRFLKNIYGENVNNWTESDLSNMGDLLISLTSEELNSIPLENLAKVLTTLIHKSGLNKMIKMSNQMEKLSFVDSCADSMTGESEKNEFLASYKGYMKRLAQASEWISKQSDSSPKVTCNGLKLAGPAALGYTIDDFKTMDHENLFDCVELIGSLNWDSATKIQLLQLLQEQFQLSSNPLDILTLIELGNLVKEITSFQNAPLRLPDSLDSIAVIGSQVTNTSVLEALASKFNQDNGLSLQTMTFLRSNNLRTVITSLGNVICGLTEFFITHFFDTDPALYMDTSPSLGQIEGCSFSKLAILASHATRPTNYGAPETWTIADVRTIGIIVAGLPPAIVSTIPSQSMEGLSALAVKSFPVQTIERLTPAQISRLTPEAAFAIDKTATANFSPEQLNAYQGATAIEHDMFIPLGIQINGSSKSSFAGFGNDPFEENKNTDNASEEDPFANIDDGPNEGFEGRSISQGEANNKTSTTTPNNGSVTNGSSNGQTNATSTGKTPTLIPSGHADDFETLDDSDNTMVMNNTDDKTSPHPEKESSNTKKSSAPITLMYSSILVFLCLSSNLLVTYNIF